VEGIKLGAIPAASRARFTRVEQLSAAILVIKRSSRLQRVALLCSIDCTVLILRMCFDTMEITILQTPSSSFGLGD
jgi:hypothetical protein